MKRSVISGVALAAGLLVALPAGAMDYSGKTMTIIYGYGAGGTYGKTSLLLSRHLGKFIPGNPTIITKIHAGRRRAEIGELRLQCYAQERSIPSYAAGHVDGFLRYCGPKRSNTTPGNSPGSAGCSAPTT